MYQAVVATNAISMPVNNSYLYLVWDLREVNNASLCYSTTSPLDACCNCIPACTSGFFGPVQNTQALACTTNTTTPGSNNWSWNGTGSTPQIGEVVYTDLSCGVLGAPTAPSGYYITNIIATTGANDWVQLNNYGQVIGSGSC